MKRYDDAYRFGETVLKTLGWSGDEIAATLTDALVQTLAGATQAQQTNIFRELDAQRLSAIASDDDVPTYLKSVDFRCDTENGCGLQLRDELVDVPEGMPLPRLTMTCPKCGLDARYFLPLGTRLAVQGEENVPREQLDAARRGLVRNPPPGFEPYRGDGSRKSVEAWETRHDISPMASDEGRRGNATITSKTKHTQTVEFEQKLAANVDQAWEVAVAGGDRRAAALAEIGRPDAFDVDRFKEQATGGVVDGPAPLAAGGTAVPVNDVAEELAPIQRANQSRKGITPEGV